ncbi:hypothetical protein MSM1_09415 [Mycobacterium sp. SM1]|uniref:hypothetical protein n=1 Tax=Mycobacterium sp. SM1 TaxID=2816243 RepID=UPI001BCEFB1F|nr:hypothetical protein [Mycobacterium sp. SM1]MBS4728549.1 hypothetical protein [Mycobacterium sp. SM1]
MAAPAIPGVIAVRANGYLAAAGLPIWAQHSTYVTYVAGSERSGQGRLIAHAISIEAGSRAQLNDEITMLSDTVHHAFLPHAGHPPQLSTTAAYSLLKSQAVSVFTTSTTRCIGSTGSNRGLLY